MAKTITHEAYIAAIWAIIRKRPALTKEDRAAMDKTRLSYGVNPTGGTRGVTWKDGWNHNVGGKPKIGMMICLHADGQESLCQLAGTTLHEAAHVIAGLDCGHDGVWKSACARVGLPAAVNGTAYSWDKFDPAVAKAIQRLKAPNDGWPVLDEETKQAFAAGKVKPCGAGHGTRGGTSRGKGAGSRHYRYICEHKAPCALPPKINCGFQTLQADCRVCKQPYTLDEASLPPSTGMGKSGQGVSAATARAHGARKPKAKPKPRKRGKRALPKAGPATQRAHAKRVSQAPLAVPAEPAPAEPIAKAPECCHHDHT